MLVVVGVGGPGLVQRLTSCRLLVITALVFQGLVRLCLVQHLVLVKVPGLQGLVQGGFRGGGGEEIVILAAGSTNRLLGGQSILNPGLNLQIVEIVLGILSMIKKHLSVEAPGRKTVNFMAIVVLNFLLVQQKIN